MSNELVELKNRQVISVNKVRSVARELAWKDEVPDPVRRMKPLPCLGQTDIRNQLVKWLQAPQQRNWVEKASNGEATPATFQFVMPFTGNASQPYPVKSLLDQFLREFYESGSGVYVYQPAPQGCEEELAYLEAKYHPEIMEAMKKEFISFFTELLYKEMSSNV